MFDLLRIPSNTPAIATFVGIPLLGIGLFWIRERYRLSYGIAEFAFGIFGAIAAFWPDFDYSTLDQKLSLQAAGSLYVMVRGMDNIGKGLEGTRWEGTWKRAFGKS